MQRILEPEVMDSLAQALEYDQMNFEEVNRAFVQETLELAPKVAKVLDAGTGTARIPILMVQQRPHWTVVGIDLAKSMLALGNSNVQAASLTEKICLERFDVKQMPYQEQSFDLVVSNSLLHHLPDPLPFLQEVKRVLRPTGRLFFRDLLRPDSPAQLAAMVAAICSDYSPQQRQLFQDSLGAAFTLAEIRELLRAAALENVQVYQSSERHWSAKL